MLGGAFRPVFGGHDISCFCGGDSFEQVGSEEMDAIGDGMARGVAAGDGDGRGRKVRGVNPCAGQLFCESDRDATGAGANVGDLQAFAAKCLLAAGANFADGEAVERDFDEVFRFWAGNQDVRRNFKFQSPEFLFSGEMLRGLAARAARNELKETPGVRRGNLFLRVSVDPGAISAEDMKQKKFRGKRVRRNARGAQSGEALFQCRANVHRFPVGRYSCLAMATSRKEQAGQTGIPLTY